MNRRAWIPLFSIVAVTACTDIDRSAPCGNTRQVDARVLLPDTGIGAGGNGTVGFFESAPGLGLDESSLIVWIFPPANATFADAPPRIRVVTDGGMVFLDLQSTSAYQGSWYAKQDIPHGDIRDAIVSAFQAGVVTIEFSNAQPTQKATHVRPTVQFAGRTPPAVCL